MAKKNEARASPTSSTPAQRRRAPRASARGASTCAASIRRQAVLERRQGRRQGRRRRRWRATSTGCRTCSTPTAASSCSSSCRAPTRAARTARSAACSARRARSACTRSAWKAPSEEERAHDYLWRIHQKVPRRGEIVIFNRSHYEDVLVPVVKGWIKPEETRAALRPDQRLRAACWSRPAPWS